MSIIKQIITAGGGTGSDPNATVWAGAWVTATGYFVNQQVARDGDLFLCISSHTSGATTEPGTGANWTDAWVRQIDSVSANQLAALAGTDGTPASGNKYVTNSDARMTNSRPPESHGHAQSDVTPNYPSTWYWADQSFMAKPVSVAADRYKFLTPNVVQSDVGGVSLSLSSQATLDLSLEATWDTITGTDYRTASNRAGKDFYIYLCQPGSGTAPVVKVSANATTPSGYTAANSRKVGGFPCLCVAAGTLSGHPANGYVAGDIIPIGVWDLKFRAANGNNAGMAYVAPLDTWIDIYLASGTGASTASVNGGTISDTRTWLDFVDDGAAVKKRMLRDYEFQIAAAGSNEETNIAGSADPGTTGGHSDTASRRMISNYFLEDCCGALWQWLDEQSFQPGSGSVGWKDVVGGTKGQIYLIADNADVKLIAGGYWSAGALCGSRSRGAGSSRWAANASIGCRFAARSITK